MNSMKELVQERLNRMEDLEQRSLLKQIMSGLFLNLAEHQQQLHDQLEERIGAELALEADRYHIFTTVCARDEIDPLHDYLFPIRMEDMKADRLNMKLISERLRQGEPVRLTSVMLDCGLERLKGLESEIRRFKGIIRTATQEKEIEVFLKPDDTYVKEMEKLYQLFRLNHLPWKTINNPFAFKFYDVILGGEESGWGIPEDEMIVEISIYLEEYEQFKRTEMVPLWNVQPLLMKPVGFPMPARDKVNYEHSFPLRKTGVEHGYLVDHEPDLISYVMHRKETLTVVSPRDRAEVWRALRIVKLPEEDMLMKSMRIYSNFQNEGFVDGYSRRQPGAVKTKGEIMRIIHGLEASRALQITDVRISEAGENPAVVTYDMNPFIDDRIRAESGRPVLVLAFKGDSSVQSRTELEDVMSFVVSEVQLYFPEYQCVGGWA